jgi:predicted nucleotidyltransferase
MPKKPYNISDIKEKVAPVCRESGITKLLLFGSYVTDCATDESDIDFVVYDDSGALRGSQFYAFVGDLRALFYPISVDVVESIEQIDWLESAILEEGVFVYES